MVNGPTVWRARPEGAVFGPWRAPDGAALRRMDWPVTGGGKARGRLLFANGRGDFIEKYLETYAHWRAAGWDVTSFDWRGQGGSRDADAGAPSFDLLVEDFAALIEDWRGNGSGLHVAIGHSMGGHLLLRTLIERQPALDAAVLVAPMIAVNSAPMPSRLAPAIAAMMCGLGFGARPMWKNPPAVVLPGGRRNRNLTKAPERYADELWWWEQEPGFDLGAPTWGWMHAAFRSAKATFTKEKLGQVTLPILLIGAEHDRLVDAAAIRRVAADLPRAELEMMADAAHEILRDADPVRSRAMARIDAFLAGLKA